jgi:hypothetical protein
LQQKALAKKEMRASRDEVAALRAELAAANANNHALALRAKVSKQSMR